MLKSIIESTAGAALFFLIFKNKVYSCVQGMAYAILAGVDPVVGIYTAFFPVLIYVFLGTMPHVSMGTFAVISILASKASSPSAFFCISQRKNYKK
jgi:MFS superfamily sulfate permease-like transporter